ncbi:hypothetical protein HCN_1750 [Helicobacter cinaedi PAGU611]|uniref:DUF493 domain-containing protein n=1 Tax=Helicobacter cinaedi CCUG 18818 = ATCC BAA-847 TaxID=537971 RepID=A0AAI8QH04_9HELI|nr:DUF493 domain-containing protein [Helicobacter cinaedi]AWK62356.1 DUF493 domain-containing protein [Helicobacter cinaedi]EFR45847.1 hypothetical protein HCCG_00393 [Helicobacter cinaedi CCUG 18818 = ATCC BAA-847]QOQ90888.1 DUF493 domain-containing protein [Helicobacter cinaedi]QOQ97009.1 DUF493 domain-containing protein [Helicobacter cinaedi]BAM12926.1 hypothetical protein HCN_1750 [Helicobacter cinaedi PAGU611]
MNLDLQKPNITYPCKWEYRIIGKDEKKLRELIFEIMPREYEIKFGKNSAQGHYVSLYVELVVQSENERNEIFSALQKSQEVKMVL